MASGLLLRGYRAALDRAGLLHLAAAAMPPASARQLHALPLLSAWLPGDIVLHLACGLEAAAGRAGCVRVGRLLGAGAGDGALALLTRTLQAVPGARPPDVYARLPLATALLWQGPTYAFAPAAPGRGSLDIHHPVPVPPALYAVWEGTLLHVQHACGVAGGVSPVQVLDGGRTGRFALEW